MAAVRLDGGGESPEAGRKAGRRCPSNGTNGWCEPEPLQHPGIESGVRHEMFFTWGVDRVDGVTGQVDYREKGFR